MVSQKPVKLHRDFLIAHLLAILAIILIFIRALKVKSVNKRIRHMLMSSKAFDLKLKFICSLIYLNGYKDLTMTDAIQPVF